MKISVVTPVLNGQPYIGACVRSVAGQRVHGVDVEHVVVDGGSTDGTAEVAEAEGATVLVGQDKGLYDAMNKGAAASTGELLCFLGSDDLLLEGALRKVAAAGDRGGDFIVGGIRWIDEDGRSLGTIAAPPQWIGPAVLASPDWCVIHQQANYVSRELFDRIGGFEEDWKVSADWEFFCRALDLTRMTRVDDVLAAFRRRPGQTSATPSAAGERELALIRDKHAPSTPALRWLYQALFRSWINARNPTWALTKRGTHVPWSHR